MPHPSKKQPIPYERVKQIIQSIEDIRTRALVAVQYGTASRIGEILPYYHKATGITTHGLLRSNIIEYGNHFEFVLPVFKNPDNIEKRSIIVKSETFLTEPILKWLKLNPGEQVFHFGESLARKLIKKQLGKGSHYLRHSRAQHLVDIFGFNTFELKETLGHKRLETSNFYVLASPTTRINKIVERLEKGNI